MLRRALVLGGVCLVLSLALIVSCVAVPEPDGGVPSSAAATPTPDVTVTIPVTTSEPMTVTEYTLTLSAADDFYLSRSRITDERQFSLAPSAFEVSADALLAALEDGFISMAGIPRLALGRVITDAFTTLQATTPITWIVFTAYPASGMSLAWEETQKERGLDGVWHTASIAHVAELSHVVSFTWGMEPLTTMTALLAARDAYAEPRKLKVWIDQMLVEEPDGSGGSQWKLYVFTNDPGGGSGPQQQRYLCCRVLQCGSASTFWQQVNCWARCRGISC